MEVAALSGIVVFLLVVGGAGWKLNSEISSIKTMLQVFIAKSEAKFDEIIRLEKRIEKLEEKILEHKGG
jgi:hypothetical protein